MILFMKSNNVISIIVWGTIIIVILLSLIIGLTLKGQDTTSSECKIEVTGNQQSDLTLKYFHSDSCPYCAQQKPILKEIVDEYGNNFKLVEYNVETCHEEARLHNLQYTPLMILEKNGISMKRIEELTEKQIIINDICKLSEGC